MNCERKHPSRAGTRPNAEIANGKVTFHSEPVRGAISHMKITAGRWVYQRESAIGKHIAVTRDQSHHTQGAAIVVLRKNKCHHNLATPTVLLLDPGWSA
jgi:hypothetical protein